MTDWSHGVDMDDMQIDVLSVSGNVNVNAEKRRQRDGGRKKKREDLMRTSKEGSEWKRFCLSRLGLLGGDISTFLVLICYMP